VNSLLRLRRDGAIARLALDRPPLNVLSRPLNRELAGAIEALSAEPDVAVIVIGGGEARGFSAGVEVADHVPATVAGMLEDFHQVVRALWRCDAITVAAVHGVALGGGFELALACDLVVAESNATLGLPEIQLGCYPPVGAAVLPARIGWAAACELVLGGEPLTPERAAALGLVNRVCAPGALEAATAELIRPLLARSPAVLRETKRALREGATQEPAAALRGIERRYLADLMRLDDAAEGVRAFVEKRAPRWTNR
jgi:cyclohexa-1,5-dienecarbonyl-CoA hydratase